MSELVEEEKVKERDWLFGKRKGLLDSLHVFRLNLILSEVFPCNGPMSRQPDTSHCGDAYTHLKFILDAVTYHLRQ